MTVQNSAGGVAANSGEYGMWLAQLMLQKKSMDGQSEAVAQLLESLPSPNANVGRNFDVRV